MIRLIETVGVPAVTEFTFGQRFRETTIIDGVPFAFVDPKFREHFSELALTDKGLPATELSVCEVTSPQLARTLYQGPASEVHPAHLFELLRWSRTGGNGAIKGPTGDNLFGPTHRVFMRDAAEKVWLIEFSLIRGGGASCWCLHLLELYVPVWSIGARPIYELPAWHLSPSDTRTWLPETMQPLRRQHWDSCATGQPQEPYPRVPKGAIVVLGTAP